MLVFNFSRLLILAPLGVFGSSTRKVLYMNPDDAQKKTPCFDEKMDVEFGSRSSSQLTNFLHLVIMGAPGSGKSTQSKLLANKFGLQHISIDDLLRKEINEKTDLGVEIEAFNSSRPGEPLDCELTEKLLFKNAPTGGYVLDGFPKKNRKWN